METLSLKLLLDQHLSRSLLPHLEPLFPGSTHIAVHGLQTSDDDKIWEFARANNFVITTKDEDFQLLSFAKGHPPKVIWLRSGNGPTSQVLEVIVLARSVIENFGTDTDQSLLVLP